MRSLKFKNLARRFRREVQGWRESPGYSELALAEAELRHQVAHGIDHFPNGHLGSYEGHYHTPGPQLNDNGIWLQARIDLAQGLCANLWHSLVYVLTGHDYWDEFMRDDPADSSYYN